MNWFIPALLSALFAGATAILAKIGIKDINSNLATAIRTIVILVFAWGIVFGQGLQQGIAKLSGTTLLFLILSGITTGVSWLFYFRALQIGTAGQVAPIDKLSLVFTIILAGLFLHEKITFFKIIGTGLMIAGAIITTLK